MNKFILKFGKHSIIQTKTSLIASVFSFTISFLFYLNYVLTSNAIKELYYNPESTSFFYDDRDGWIRFASAFSKGLGLDNEMWQINFWPPGNIGYLALLATVTKSIFVAVVLHGVTILFLQAFVTYKIALLLRSVGISPIIVITCIILFQFSFLHRSAIIDGYLLPDYFSTLLFLLGIMMFYENLKSKKMNFINILVTASLFAFAAHVRVTYYNLELFSLLVVLAFVLVYYFKVINVNKILFLKIVSTMLITMLMLIPWIMFRTYKIYDGDLSRGLQFSLQARFGLQYQWANKKDFDKYPSLELMGLGVACKIDPVKCEYFSKRDEDIISGLIPISMDDNYDIKSKAAIKTLLKHPLSWVKLKTERLPNAYFQKSVYDSIDNNLHFSIDLIMYIFLPFIAIKMIFVRWKMRSLEWYFATFLYIFATILTVQLLISQTLLRFFLPSIFLYLFSFLFIVTSSKNQSKVIV